VAPHDDANSIERHELRRERQLLSLAMTPAQFRNLPMLANNT